MTITKINNTSFMFEFLQDELTFNTEDDLIYHIMNIVATVEKLNIKHCAFVLEAVKSRKGSIFLLTIRYGRKRFKVKRNLEHTIYSFENCDDYLNCIFTLHKSSYSLSRNHSYIMDNKYYLCLSNSFISKKTKLLVCQYGEKCENSNILLARLKEYGKYIGENCVENISKNLTYKEF